MSGFAILSQSLRLIFGNLPQSIKLSSPLGALLILALLLYGPDYFVQDIDPNDPNSLPASSLLFQLLTLVFTMWVAVSWHRFVLLEEYPNGVLPKFHGGLMLAYFGYGILLGIVVGLGTIALGALVGLALFMVPVLMIAGIMIVSVAGAWAFYRLSPILPACAIGNKLGMKEAWAATKPHSGAILSAMIIFVVSIFALAFAGAIIASAIPFLGGVMLLAFNWLYILLGISFLTTLYGVAVEGRSIGLTLAKTRSFGHSGHMSEFRKCARTAEAAMRSVFAATPLQLNVHLSARFGADIWLKREDLTPVRSYKLRGAFNAMRKRRAENPDQRIFVCASAGNHAQGVAYMCKHFDVQGVIFMPVTTPQQKIFKTQMFGGENVEIRLVGDYFDDTLAAAQTYCSEAGAVFLSPFDDEDVIEGQASVAVEVEDQLGKTPDHIILPVGGGGLSSGVRSYFGDALNYTLVEPEGGKSLAAALKEGRPVKLNQLDGFVDGAAVARIGDKTFARLSDMDPTDVVAASEDRICATMIEMLNVEGIVLEPAGALAVDALTDVAGQIKGKTVVCVTSGGNFDFERLPEVKERAQRFSGVKKYFILRMPQRPGALRDFLETLGPEDDIARFEYLKKSARNFGSVLIGIETKRENFDALFARIDAAGMTYTDITDDETLGPFVL